MRNFYLTCFFLGIFQICGAQNTSDHIYKIDQSDFAALVDEIGKTEIIYFLPADLARKQPQSILKSTVWKIVYANGETEMINAPAALVLDKIYLNNGQILEARILEVGSKSVNYAIQGEKAAAKINRNDVHKLVYASGHEEILTEPKVAKSVEKSVPVEKTNEVREEEAEKEGAVVSKSKSKKNTENQGDDEPEKEKRGKAVKVKEEVVAVTEPVNPNEIVIRIQNDFDPGNTAKKQEVREYKNYVGIRFGGSATGFYEDKITKPETPSYNWEAGLGFSLANTKHYNARLELVYINKGAVEKFEDDNGMTLTSRNKFTYFQGNLLPLIIKTGARKLNPVIGVGGYYAYLYKNSSELSEDGENFEEDEDTAALFENKTDYGLCAMLGFYSGHKPLLEFRYEYGLGEVMKDLKIKNHGLSVSLFLSF